MRMRDWSLDVCSSDLLDRAIGFRAAEQVNDFLPRSRKDLASFEGPHLAFKRAYGAAGISVNDLDFAEVHDCFTIAELLTLEAMGLCKPGDASQLVREGQTERGGRLDRKSTRLNSSH